MNSFSSRSAFGFLGLCHLMLVFALVGCEASHDTPKFLQDQSSSREDKPADDNDNVDGGDEDIVDNPDTPTTPLECDFNGGQILCSELPQIGRVLYTETFKCARCHDPFESSDVQGATFEEINEAIATIKKMERFSTVTPDERRALAAALSL
jgi:hypothetical protein